MLIPLLGRGLLTAEGDEWLRHRRLASPAFHRERVEGYGRTMAATRRMPSTRGPTARPSTSTTK
jgi:cytochrome P450